MSRRKRKRKDLTHSSGLLIASYTKELASLMQLNKWIQYLQRIWNFEKAIEPENIGESSQVSTSQETSYSFEWIKSQNKESSYESNQDRLLAGTDVSVTSKEEDATTSVKDNDLSSGLRKRLILSANGKECSNAKAEKIVEEKEKYACFTCNKTFTGEEQLCEHVNGKKHRSQMLLYTDVDAAQSTSEKKNSASNDTTASSNNTSTTMQKKRKRKPARKKNADSIKVQLMFDGVCPTLDARIYFCCLCKKNMSGFKCAVQHTKGKRHTKNFVALSEIQRMLRFEEAVEPENISKSSQVSTWQETSNSFESIKSQDKEKFYKSIQDCLLAGTDVSITSKEEEATTSEKDNDLSPSLLNFMILRANGIECFNPKTEKIVEEEEMEYVCFMCNEILTGKKQVYKHINGKKHSSQMLLYTDVNAVRSTSEKKNSASSDPTAFANNTSVHKEAKNIGESSQVSTSQETSHSLERIKSQDKEKIREQSAIVTASVGFSMPAYCPKCMVYICDEETLIVHLKSPTHKRTHCSIEQGSAKLAQEPEAQTNNVAVPKRVSYHCHLCDIQFKKYQMLIRHSVQTRHVLNKLRGIKENKCSISKKQRQLAVNDEKKKSNNVNSLVYKCDLCNVKVARDKMLVEHFNGKKHKGKQNRLLAGISWLLGDVYIASKKGEATTSVNNNDVSSGLRKLSTLNASNDETLVVHLRSPAQKRTHCSIEQSSAKLAQKPKLQASNVAASKEISYNCHLADIQFKKNRMLIRHFGQAPHILKTCRGINESMCSISEKQGQLPVNDKKKKSKNVNSLVYRCDLCNVKVTRDKILVEHFNGKKHKSKKNRLLADISWLLGDVSITSKEEKATTSVTDSDLSSSLRKLLTLSANGKKCCNTKAEKIVEEKKMEYACFTCNGKYTSEKQLNEHINGKKHRRQMLLRTNVDAARSTSEKKNSASSDTTASSDFFKTLKSKYLISALDIKLSTRMSFAKDAQVMYCLACKENVPNKFQTYYEHIRCVPHLNNLELMIKDDIEFENFPDEFSDLALAKEFMQELSNERVKCFACDADLWNKNSTLRQHIATEAHGEKRKYRKGMTQWIFDEFLSQIEQIWYYTQKYCCQLCDCVFDIDAKFEEHLWDDKHGAKLKLIGTSPDKLGYEFCAPCATVWIGCADSFSKHCQDKMHKYMLRSGIYMARNMPDSATQMLKNMQGCVDELIEQSNKHLSHKRRKQNKLLKYLESMAKTKFPSATAYSFGSRISRLGFPDSDIDIFIDCGNTYYGENSATSRQLLFIEAIKDCLLDKEEIWTVEEILTRSRTPIIKSVHRPTELKCDIVVTNGLSVENTNLLKCFAETYPLCRKLILFLKKWLAECGLSGVQCITSYALAWYVIFYLQTESILPSIDRLIKLRNKSIIVAGWEVGVCYEFHFNQPSLTLSELLLGFYEYYAEFDYRFDVVCPLIGCTVKKRAFLEPATLPKEMTRYVEYLKTSKDPEPFRIDSAMCIQDPFDLSHNLTETVPKFALNRFRQFCGQCANILHEPVTI